MTSNKQLAYVAFLSTVAAIGGFLFGYDTAVISGTVSQVSALYGLNELQAGWYVGCALIGSIGGVAVAGSMSDNLGRRLTMMISAVLFTVSAAGCCIADNINELVIYRIIGGVGIGIVSIVSPMYISEVSITRYRGRLVSLYQLAITVGFLAAYLVNFQILEMSQSITPSIAWIHRAFVAETWRGMLGMETLPAFLFLVVVFLIPESPRWLLLKGRREKALRTLGRIYEKPEEFVANQSAEVAQDKAASTASGIYAKLFRPPYRQALFFGVAIAILGQFMGVNAVLYYGPTIFENAGLSSGDSLFYQVMVGLVNMLTTVLALMIIDRVGRKALVYYGVSGMIISLLLIAAYFTWGDAMGLPAVVLLAFFLAYVFCTAVSICAVVWVLLSEMYPTSIRAAAMSIAGFALWIGTYLIGQLTPWLLENLMPAGTFILFAIMCLPYLWIMWRHIPETAGRTLEEIDAYWHKH